MARLGPLMLDCCSGYIGALMSDCYNGFLSPPYRTVIMAIGASI
jgi:hypothetical protein